MRNVPPGIQTMSSVDTLVRRLRSASACNTLESLMRCTAIEGSSPKSPECRTRPAHAAAMPTWTYDGGPAHGDIAARADHSGATARNRAATRTDDRAAAANSSTHLDDIGLTV